MPSRAAFYICDGYRTKYLWEAVSSAKSVKEKLDLPCYLFTRRKMKERVPFDGVFEMPPRASKLWFLDSTMWHVMAVEKLMRMGYDELLYLDTDTHVCYPCLDIFDVLEEYDFAICHSPGRDATPTTLGAPAAFCTPEVGVQVFRANSTVFAMLSMWSHIYQENQGIYGNNDQGPLRDVLWKQKTVRWMTLPPEYGLRYQFGAWVYGPVRILHGRGLYHYSDQASLSDVCAEINARTAMRMWSHGLIDGEEDDRQPVR